MLSKINKMEKEMVERTVKDCDKSNQRDNRRLGPWRRGRHQPRRTDKMKHKIGRTTLLHESVILAAILILSVNPVRAATRPGPQAKAPEVLNVASPEKIIQYVRDRFQVPESVKLTVEPLHKSSYPALYETLITSDDGKQKRTNNVFITDDGRCFVMGNVFALNGDSNAEIIRCVRDAAKLPEAENLSVGALEPSAYPGFLKATLTATEGDQKKTGVIFVAKDHRTGVLGMMFPYRRDFVEQLISTKGQPAVGPANARVTVVEYADLQCPTCALFQKTLENEILPNYSNKVRFIFKDFLIPTHDWSRTAAIANECAFQVAPSTFANYRTLIFAAQDSINATNVHDRLLQLAGDAGIDSGKLTACTTSGGSLGRIQRAAEEAENVGLRATPTIFVNGRIVVGAPPAADFEKILDSALAEASRR
jgi:protein-disulfide isomerase